MARDSGRSLPLEESSWCCSSLPPYRKSTPNARFLNLDVLAVNKGLIS